MGDPHDGPADGPGEERFRERLREAAIEAEFESGVREETEEQARAHIALRLARITGGSVLLVAGVAMLALPGPGWLTIALGLALLAQDVPWAERTLERVRRRLPADAEGNVNKGVIWGSLAVAAVVTGSSLWWTFLR